LFSTFWMLGSLVILSTFLAALWLRLNIGKPLAHLISRMKLVHNGNLDADSGIQRQDEIGVFASEFDLMRISLRESIRELANHKEQLEETVKMRTAALQQANKALKLMSHTDHLTGIPNRRDIMEKIHYEMFRAERTHQPFSFLFADIDKFKNFNDTYGHECGDMVLKTVAQVMRGMLRKPDYMARWGGEEFLVVLPETSLENAKLVAERIRALVAATEFNYGGHIFKVTITLGVALFDIRLGIEFSINLADRALYRGKESGRNRVDVWDPSEVTAQDYLAAQKLRDERGGAEFPPLDLDSIELDSQDGNTNEST
jgi:diguanylate cyclase (GGDEF)-like protein